MRDQLRDGKTITCLATMINSTPTGNMFPSFRILEERTIRLTNFYCVKGLITNAQNFIKKVAHYNS